MGKILNELYFSVVIIYKLSLLKTQGLISCLCQVRFHAQYGCADSCFDCRAQALDNLF